MQYTSNSNLTQCVTSIARNTFGVRVVLETKPRMRKTNNPYIGRVTKVTEIHNVALGRDYLTAVTRRADQVGGDASTFVPQGASGMVWVQHPYFLESIKDSNTHYLRLTLNRNSKCEVKYLVDGRAATDTEVAELKAFLYDSHSYSQKQASVGITNEYDQVKPMSVMLENILLIEQGDKIYRK